MTDKQALAKARKMLGLRAYIEKNPAALTGDALEEARDASAAHREAMPDKSDRDAYRKWREEHEPLKWNVLRRRCTVGRIVAPGGITFREVLGEGDDWDEALARAAKR